MDLFPAHRGGKRKETARQSLRKTHHIRNDAGVFARKHAARPAKAGEDLVGDEEDIVLRTQLMKSLKPVHGIHKHACGCLNQWLADNKLLQAQLADRLLAFEEMLAHRLFLLGARPRFVDFDLMGMLDNFLYSGHYKLPARHSQIQKWYRRLASAKLSDFVT